MTAGKVYIQQEEYDKAIEQFDLQLKERPDDMDAWWWRGMSHTYQKEYEGACECIDKVIEGVPEKRELQEQKPFLWSLYYSAGITALQDEDWELAKKRLHGALKFQPDSTQSYMHLAMIASQQGHEDTMLTYYRRILEIDPENSLAYKNLGAHSVREKKYDEAIDYFTKGLKADSKDADLSYRLGIAYYLKKDHVSAEGAFRQAIENDSTLQDAYFNLGATLGKMEKYDEAIEVLKRAVEYNPEDAEALIHLGGTYLLTKKYDLAIETYTTVIESDPSNRDAYEGRANAYWKLGKKADAETDYRKVKEMEK
jgi:tetratricopeptide (TPR) repeat protein